MRSAEQHRSTKWPSPCCASWRPGLIWLFLATLITSLSVSPESASAQSRWVVAVKTGATLGNIGVEVERAWGETAVLFNVGSGLDRPMSALFLIRRYASNFANRGFFDFRLGIVGIGDPATGESLSFFGSAAGYEWQLAGFLRLAAEAGIGLFSFNHSFTPLSQAGVFLGVSMGVVF